MRTLLHTDMNKFYASCERAFRPELRRKPVVVLSNNDGCVVALTKEAKALGIRRGVPYFQIKEIAQKHDVAVLSSNYELYQSMSDRIASIIQRHVPVMERYSIDEIFADLTGVEGDLTELGRGIRSQVDSWTRIPSCVGIGPTKTLAKLCDHFAKEYDAFGGVVNWFDLTDERRHKALNITPIDEIWGIGGRTAEKLRDCRVRTAGDFIRMSPLRVRQLGGVVLMRTWSELQGEYCIPIEAVPKPRLQICRSRSFGTTCSAIDDIRASVITHVGEACRVMRREGLRAKRLTVFYYTNIFREDLPQYSVEVQAAAPYAAADTLLFSDLADRLITQTFRSGFEYKKAGIILSDLTAEKEVSRMPTLFDEVDDVQRTKREALMKTVDELNARYGKISIVSAASELSHAWVMKRDLLSPCCTTRIEDVITAN